MTHDHDLSVRCAVCTDWPDYWADLAIRLDTLGDLMTSFADDQAHLDSDVQAETTALSAVEAEIAALKAQPAAAALNFTALDAVVARLGADAPAAATPAPTPAPVVTPTSAPVTSAVTPAVTVPVSPPLGTAAVPVTDPAASTTPAATDPTATTPAPTVPATDPATGNPITPA